MLQYSRPGVLFLTPEHVPNATLRLGYGAVSLLRGVPVSPILSPVGCGETLHTRREPMTRQQLREEGRYRMVTCHDGCTEALTYAGRARRIAATDWNDITRALWKIECRRAIRRARAMRTGAWSGVPHTFPF